MNPRGHMQPYLSNSLAIRQEIQRFESVHPSIYAIYDLIEAIPDPLILQQIREHVVSIEDSFVNSQEWTLSRSVPDLKLGILGTINSGKSALVHRYLTGSYMQEESPEGGRFKKEVVIDGQSYLLLIRDEGGSPEMQFTHWVDAIIFVFSLENETSFNAIYHYYAKMAHYRNAAEVPIILVGTQDAISESNPRVIDDSRARKLANDLKRCSYYETCATYGLNVERVFQDACQKINHAKATALTPNNSRPSTPNHPGASSTAPRAYHTQGGKGGHDTHSTSSQSTSGSGNLPTATPSNSSHSIQGHSPNATGYRDTLPSKDKERSKHDKKHRDKDKVQTHMEIVPHAHPHGHHGGHGGQAIPVAIPVPPTIPVPPPPDRTPPQEQQMPIQAVPQSQVVEYRDVLATPGSTPIFARKNKKTNSVTKSNSFSGPAILHRAQSQPNGSPELRTPTSTPILSRKNKSKQSYITPDSSPDHAPSGLTPLLARKEPRYRFSLIVDRMDTFMKELQTPKDSPLTPLLSRIPRVRSIVVIKPQKPRSKLSGLELSAFLAMQVSGTLAASLPAVQDRQQDSSSFKDMPTPSSTPTQTRKNRRRSNLFTQKKGEEEAREKSKTKNGEVGSGRVIPCKQGFLYKKSSNPLNKEWKKKYVTLLDDGRLTYHPSLHDYMDDVHAKVINLVRTTVKVPGQRPRGSKTVAPDVQANGQMNNLSGRGTSGKEGTTFDIIRDGGIQRLANCEDGSVVIPNASLAPDAGESGLLNGLDYMMNPPATPNSKIETPNVKKRHRRAKSGTNKVDPSQDGDSDGYEFVIVSLDNKSWHFEAQNVEERDEWVTAIEQQILSSLQANMATESSSSKSKTTASRPAATTDPAARQAMRAVKGNDFCVDCGAPNPDWASLNLGALMCIECSGIHRNLGTHLSRVRSVDLDEWPPDLVLVMTSIGNTLANSVWEASSKGKTKPTPTTPREEKEVWIRAKYESKEFLPAPPYLDVPLPQQLIDAVARQDVQSCILVLAYAKPDHVNTPFGKQDTRTGLHIAAALGNVTILQLLVWYGGNVKAVDHHGRNALWYARTSQSHECIELLRNQGCPENPTLPRRRGSQQPGGGAAGGNNEMFDKLPASII